MTKNIAKIISIFERAESEGRNFLLEPEVYEVLRLSGIRPPKFFVLPKGRKADKKDLAALGTAKVVLKIVSPLIVHKSDVGGVVVTKADPGEVNRACLGMMGAVPKRFVAWKKKFRKPGGKAPSGPNLDLVQESVKGFMVCEKVDYENVGFGSEVLLGIRNTREFGPVVTIGGGGLDVEYMNDHLKQASTVATSSVHLASPQSALSLLEPLAFFGKLARNFRGRKPLVSSKTLVETFRRFQKLAREFSSFEKKHPYVIEEAEVNPFVARSGELIPLDGMCRFSRNHEGRSGRPLDLIGRLLRPETIGIIGVSDKMNIGHIILNNILKNGFPREKVYIVKPGTESVEGCRCFSSVADLPQAVDLFVLTLAAEQCYEIIRDLVDYERAHSVIIIAGGLGEKKGTGNLEDLIQGVIRAGRSKGKMTPVLNGGNSLGIYSRPGKYDTTFIPEHKLPRPKSRSSNLVFISQSGAFMICRTSAIPGIEPLYAVSLGNQIDLTASDYLNFLKDDPEAKIFAVYMEGFKPGDGYAFAQAVKEISSKEGKRVVVYKSGRSPEGRAATTSHTASVAGDYDVFRSVVAQAGAVVAEDIFEFENFIKAFIFLADKRIRGNGVGLISNAGFECVIMADNLKNGGRLEPVQFSLKTRARLSRALGPLGIDRLQDIRNPLDITPVADDAVFAECATAILEDENVDCAVVSPVPMTPAMQTLAPSEAYKESILNPGSFAQRIIRIFRATEKPFVVNIDAGRMYDPLARLLEEAGIPTFRRADEALRFLRKFAEAGSH